MAIGINSFKQIIGRLRVLLPRRYKIRLVILLFMTVFLSIVETFGVSIIMPFISVAANPDMLDGGRYNAIFRFLGFTSKNSFIFCFGIGILAFYIFRAAYNIFYTYIQNRFALGTYRYLADNLYSVFLSLPYKVYVQKNSSETFNGINQANNVSTLLLCVMQICSDSFTTLMLYSFMVIVNWRMTILLTAILVLLVLIIIKIILKRSKIQGAKALEATRKMNKLLNESYGNFKFVRIKGVEGYYKRQFDESAIAITKAQVISTTLGAMPRNLLESIGFSLLVGAVLLIMFRYGSAESVIPIIAMYALAMYRILPSINRMLGNVNQIVYLQSALDVVYEQYTQETVHEGGAPVTFNSSIVFDNVSFQYLKGPPVLKNVSLVVNKGDKVAITGPSGGGKSTLADMIIGMNRPLSGSILVDGTELTDDNIRSWRKRIGYIPQDIYLFDDTVAENITIGSPYDRARLERVLYMANIWDFLEKKDGAETRVGERGVQLSGGQKQRIGIARALYNDPDILILDEATSALDSATESNIMDEIYEAGKNKTLIIIAHRLTTIERCERKFYVENGVINES